MLKQNQVATMPTLLCIPSPEFRNHIDDPDIHDAEKLKRSSADRLQKIVQLHVPTTNRSGS